MLTVAGAIALVSVVSACTSGTTAAGSGSPDVGIGVGQFAPPLSGMTLDGGSLSLASVHGRPVLVNFWASWCVPCRSEFPLFKAALARHPDLVIIGVIFQDDPASAKAFVSSFGASWQSVLDPTAAMANAYRVVAPPQSYFIDRNGIVRSRQIGELTTVDFERQYAAIGP